MALIPHWRIRGRQRKSSEVSQTPRLTLSTGLAYRRCELSWVNGEQIGAKFMNRVAKKK
jgi:hypothetical protein